MLLRSLRYYWRQNLAVVTGVAVSALILVGALLVGDSMRFSLERLARLRLGKIEAAVVHPTGFFREKLADDLGGAPLLLLRGSVTTLDERRRVHQVQIVGVDDRFWSLRDAADTAAPRLPAINEVLAQRLGRRAGEVVVQWEQPSGLPREAPLARDDDAVAAARVPVVGVVGDEALGRFSLTASQITPPTLFVSLEWLQAQTDRRGRANVVLLTHAVPVAPHWTLDDAELELRALAGGGWQLTSRGVFFDLAVAGAQPIFTYLANELRHGERATPYAIVSAGPRDLPEDEIILTDWLAEDLQARVGDRVTMRYYVVGPLRTLVEREAAFRVRAIEPLRPDAELLPAFPGLAGTTSCRDWAPGVPLDLRRLRDKDQEYWERYGGTPKAFIAWPAAQRLWETRFGRVTALRWPAGVAREEIEQRVRAVLPAPVAQPVGEQARRASREALDFGQLFLGFSFFLIVAALVLTGLLFALGLQARCREIGILLALGWPAARVRRWWWAQAGVLAGTGAAVGTAAGMGYTWLALTGLMTWWRDAVSGTELHFHATPATLATGLVASVGMAGAVIAWRLRRWVRLPARVLLAREAMPVSAGRGAGRWAVVAGVAGVGVLILGGESAAAFFVAGALWLAAGIGWSRRAVGGGRGLATVTMLACGVFLVVAVGANRRAPEATGTGGFDLWVETTAAVHRDLNEPATQAEWGLPAARYVPVRVREGDDASCLNLNRAQTPRLLGVRPADLAGRFAADWERLEAAGAEVPAIGDEATVRWGLGRKVGDVLRLVDERGEEFAVRIVGLMANSVLQGSLVVSERRFVEKFPGASGYRLVLVEGTSDGAAVARALADFGAEVEPARERLARLLAVENTYLDIFQALGGLGLILGCVGLGVVVLRNVWERRAELALRRAVGFSQRRLRRLVMREHVRLVAWGVGTGAVAGLVAVLPAMGSAAGVRWGALAGTLAVVVATAWGWIAVASRAALRGGLLEALRSE